MKKIIFLTVVIIYSFIAKGQQITFDNGINFSVPANAEKLNKIQALDHVNKKFKNDKNTIMAVNLGFVHGNKQFYRINDILFKLTIFDTTYSFKKNQILYLKNGEDAYGKYSKNYSSKLEKYNNYSVVIMDDITGSVESYTFICINDNNTRQFDGELEFNSSDKAEATVVLNNLLASIKFKD